MSEFTESKFEDKLSDLTGSDSSIKTLSTWIISHRRHFQVIGATLYKVLVITKKVKTLTFVYLVHEIVVRSKNKHPEFIVEFGNLMKKVLEYLVESNDLEEKTKSDIWNLIKKWREQEIFGANKQNDLETIWKGSITGDTRSTSPKGLKASKHGQDLYCALRQEVGHVTSESCHAHALCRNCGVKGHVKKECPRPNTVLEKTQNEKTKVDVKEEQRSHARNENVRAKIEGNENYTEAINSNEDDDVIFLEQKVGGPKIPIVTITFEENPQNVSDKPKCESSKDLSEEKMGGPSEETHIANYEQKNDTNTEFGSLELNSARRNKLFVSKNDEFKPLTEKSNADGLCGGMGEGTTVGTIKVEQLPCAQNAMFQNVNNKSSEVNVNIKRRKKYESTIKHPKSKWKALAKEFMLQHDQKIGTNTESVSPLTEKSNDDGLFDGMGESTKVGTKEVKQLPCAQNAMFQEVNNKSSEVNVNIKRLEREENDKLNNEQSKWDVPPKIAKFESLDWCHFEVNNNSSENDDVIFIEKVVPIKSSDPQQGNQRKVQNKPANTIPTHAKDNLHGMEVFKGSRTLNVEYAKKDESQVVMNDETSCNITTGHVEERFESERGAETIRNKEATSSEAYENNVQDIRSRVVMFYTTSPEKMNCNILFNLFSQYGNVRRIVFMKNKKGCAMLEMEDQESTERSIRYLNRVKLFGSHLQLEMSWLYKTLANMKASFQLPDGSPALKDYSGHSTSRSGLPFNAPSKVLIFENLPKMEDSEIDRLFWDNGALRPLRKRWFPSLCENSPSHMGLMEFHSIEESFLALALVNHVEVKSSQSNQKFPTKLNLSFGPPTYSV